MQSESENHGPAAPVGAAGILAFVLEVAMLCAAGLWAIEVLPLHPVLAVVVVAVPLLLFWGLFMAPQSRRRIGWPLHPLVAHGLFVLGGVLLLSIGRVGLGASMLVLTGLSALLSWRDRGRHAEEAALAAAVRRGDANRQGGRRRASR
jgi:hypothetical protein